MNRRGLSLLFVVSLCAFTQTAPQFDSRLRVSTLVREDLFAGFLTNDMTRMARGEKNLELLLEERPKSKAEIRAWQGGAALFHATRSHEQKNPAEFERHYKRAVELFNEAASLAPGSEAVAAITGGSHTLFMDRVPERHRAEVAGKAYAAYELLLAKQGPVLEKMPVHHRGEILSGLAQSGQRLGRTQETTQYLDKIISMLPNTPYEARAKKWKENPEIAARTSIACMTCHDAGKLEIVRGGLTAQQ